jgi:hypothetical protein
MADFPISLGLGDGNPNLAHIPVGPTGSHIYPGDASGAAFEFRVDGEYVVPDSATYWVRDNAGTVIDTGAVTLTDSTTQVLIQVAGNLNSIAGGKTFENRTVEVLYFSGAASFRVRQSYRVIPWLNYTCTMADVRDALGLLDHELADDDTGMFEAYYLVAERVGATQLASSLVAGDVTTQYANLAIVCRCALSHLGSLQLKAAQSTQDDNLKFSRADIDWAALQMDLTDTYEDALYSMIPVVLRTRALQQVQLRTSQPTDTITGVG